MTEEQKSVSESKALTKNNIFSRDELIKCGRHELAGAGVPLPLPDMLMVDRVIEMNRHLGIHGKGEIVGELDLNPDLWFFQCHFKDDPIMPGTLVIDALFQLLGFYLGWLGYAGKGRALSCGKIKFKEEVSPGSETLVYRVSLKKIRERDMMIAVADGSADINGQAACIAEGMILGLK